MNILTLPVRAIQAKWLRSLSLTAVFTIGLASMHGLYQLSGIIADSMEKKLISYGANILVTPRQETLQVSYGGYSLGNVAMEEHPIRLDEALGAIDRMPLRANVAIVAPKLLVMTRIFGRAVALVGVDWEQELQLKSYWEIEGAFPEPGSTDDIIAGSAAARELGLVPGQILSLDGKETHLSGVLRTTGNDDDAVLFVPLNLAQSIAGKKGLISFLEVAALCSGCPIDDIVQQLQAGMPDTEVRALAQVAASRMYTVHFVQTLAFSVSLVILITACAMLVMSMLSSVAERRHEIGIMRATGFSRTNIFVIFSSEAVGIGFFAGLLGYALGQMMTEYILRALQLANGATLAFEAAPLAALILLSSATAGVSAAFPAWRATLVEPAEALVSL
ncbi:MAG: FtsX-like permease family protein [Desulfovibrio sp.]|jgi:putative ABC transport system permease protein|nr:FtsX-like permease family protein [Desulfovibrio sp.]